MTRRFALACGLALPLLGGCVSVLPKATPAQLYRFGAEGETAPAAAPASATGVMLGAVILPRAAAGDGLLTVTGDEAAYVAGARWVSPAAVLMEEATERAFAARATRVRLLRRAGPAAGAATLVLDVQRFEVRYAAPGAAPTVRLQLQATLTRHGAVLAARGFAADEPAGENRLSAIVPAYSRATGRVLDDLVAWVDAAPLSGG